MNEKQSIRDELAQVIRSEFFRVDGFPDDEDYEISDTVLASPVFRRIQAEALREALNELPVPDDDARSGMIHARGLIAELIARKSS